MMPARDPAGGPGEPGRSTDRTSDASHGTPGVTGATPESTSERRRAVEDRRRTHVTDIAHDLKTPLSIVAALLDRMRVSDGLPAAVRADADAARRQLGTMTALLAELLDPERALVRGIELDEDECDLAGVVREVVAGFEPIAAGRAIELRFDGPPQLFMVADAPRLERVVANLVANALRFAPFAGTVRAGIAGHDGTVRLEVADNGPGIPESERERIFDRSYLGAKSQRRGDQPRGVSGIGLATVKEIVTLHGGTVRAERAPEGGALFVVELPYAPPER